MSFVGQFFSTPHQPRLPTIFLNSSLSPQPRLQYTYPKSVLSTLWYDCCVAILSRRLINEVRLKSGPQRIHQTGVSECNHSPRCAWYTNWQVQTWGTVHTYCFSQPLNPDYWGPIVTDSSWHVMSEVSVTNLFWKELLSNKLTLLSYHKFITICLGLH